MPPTPTRLLSAALHGRRAEPSAATPSPDWTGGGVGASQGAGLQPCFVRRALPSTSGAAWGWGREASVLAFPTPDPGLLRWLAEAQARSRVLGGCGGCDYSCLSGEQAKANGERVPPPPAPFTGEGGSLSLHCTAQGGGGLLTGGGRYKYLQIVLEPVVRRGACLVVLVGGGLCLSWGAASRDAVPQSALMA